MNYRALQDEANAAKTILWGLGGTVALILASAFLPTRLVSPIGFASAFALRALTKQLQRRSGNPKPSWWLATLLGVLGFIITIVLFAILGIIFVLVFNLSPSGVIRHFARILPGAGKCPFAE